MVPDRSFPSVEHVREPRISRAYFFLNLFQRFFLQAVEKKFPDDRERLARMSLIEEGFPKQIRMAYLAIIGIVSPFPHFKPSC